MNQKVIELVSVLIKELLHGAGLAGRDRRLIQDLVKRGYCEEEIDAAISIIRSHPEMLTSSARQGSERSAAPRSVRAFSPVEQARLTLKARGLLLDFSTRGLLSEVEMEDVINEAMTLEGGELDVHEILWVIRHTLPDEDRAILLGTEPYRITRRKVKAVSSMN
ncbi:MAG: DUF494 family protein [Firmicutes bacterium]|nr:DUF494 family protein [Bacillota bacterium]